MSSTATAADYDKFSLVRKCDECSSYDVAMPLTYCSEEQVIRKDGVSIVLQESGSDGYDSGAHRRSVANYRSSILAGKYLGKDHDRQKELYAALQENGPQFSCENDARRENRLRTFENVNETFEVDVMAKVVPLYETTCSQWQPINQTIKDFEVDYFDGSSSRLDILPLWIPQSDEKPARQGTEGKNTKDLATSYFTKVVLRNNDNVVSTKEGNEYMDFRKDLTTNHQQFSALSTKENSVITDHKKVGNLKEMQKYREETKLQDTSNFKPEDNVHRTQDRVVRVADDHLKGEISSDESCVPEESQSGCSILPVAKSSKPRKSQRSCRGNDRQKLDSDDQKHLSRILPVSPEKPAKIMTDDNNISVASKNDFSADKTKRRTSGHTIQEIEMYPSDWRSKHCKSETMKKEQNTVNVSTIEKSEKQKFDKVDGEKKTRQCKIASGKSPNKEHHDHSTRTTENIENRASKEMLETDRHRSKNGGKVLAQYERESIDSKSCNILRQLEMAQICKKKVNVLLQQVQNIINEPETPFESIEQEKGLNNLSQKTGQHSPKGHAKSRSKFRSKSAKSCPILSSAKESLTIWTARDEKMARNQEASNKVTPKQKTKTKEFEGVDSRNGDCPKLSTNPRDKHRKRVVDGQGNYLCTQIPATTNTVRSKDKSGVNERQTINLAGKCQHGNVKHSKAPEDTSVQKHQSLSGRQHHRSYYDAERTHHRNLRSSVNTPGMYEKSNHTYPLHRSAPERARASAKHEHLEQSRQPVPAFWEKKTIIDYYQHENTTSESLDSVCVCNDCSPARHQPSGCPTTMDEAHVLIKRVTRTSTRSSSAKNEPKSEHKSSVEARQNKKSRSSLKNFLTEAIKSAKESISAAGKVADALNIVAGTSSSSSSLGSSQRTNTLSIINNQNHSKPVVSEENSVDNPAPVKVNSKPFLDSAPRHLSNVPQEMFTNNPQKINYQSHEQASKNRPTKQQTKQQELKPPLMAAPGEDSSPNIHRHVDKTLAGIDDEDPRNKSAISRERLPLIENSFQSWDDTPQLPKRFHGSSLPRKCCVDHTMTEPSPLVRVRSPKITVHITMMKSPEIAYNTIPNFISHNSSPQKEYTRNIQICPRRGRIDHRPTAASNYQSSELTTSKEQLTQSPSGSCIPILNSYLNQYSAITDSKQGNQLSTNWGKYHQMHRSCQDSVINNSRLKSTRYNGNVNKSSR